MVRSHNRRYEGESDRPGDDGAAMAARQRLRTSRSQIRLDTGLAPDITVALRMDQANEAPLDYYLLPLFEMTTDRIRLAEENGLMLDAYRFDSLEYFFAMAERVRITEITL